MYRKICCLFAVVATVLCLCMAVQATEDGASYMQLSEDIDGLTVGQDMLLDLNGHSVTNATVAEGVTLRLMDSANDTYDAAECGSFSGTINGTVEQVVKHDAKNYLVIETDGAYSAHRFYAGIDRVSLVPGSAALGYKAVFKADTVINAMVESYGYRLWVNDLNAKTYAVKGEIEKEELTARVKNILDQSNASLSRFGATATIHGMATITFGVNGQAVTVDGAEHATTLQQAVEAVNTALGNDRSAYTQSQVDSVKALYNKFTTYMENWEVGHILAVDKFAVALYEDEPAFLYRVGNSDAVKLGSLFKAVDGAQIGNVTVSISALDGTSVSGAYTANSTDWTAGTLKFTGTGPVQITIVDDDYCNPLTISLEVVAGYNVTEYSQLKNRNSVLLNDITMSDGSAYALTSGTLYGNNFTIDARKAAYTASSNKIEGNYVIRLGNATLDNVQVVGAVYTTYGSTSDSDYNRALVFINGNAVIANCYLSNTTAPVRMYKGSVEIINTTLKGGVFANMDIRAGSVILDNVTTINQINGTDRAEDGTVVAGLGIVFYYDGTPAGTSLEIRNSLTQYNFISQSQGATYIQDDTANGLVDAMFRSKYSAVQYTDASGDTWVNTGILAMIDTINGDNITDIDGYEEMAVSYLGKDGLVSTARPNQSSIDALVTDYVSAGQYAISPTSRFDYTTKNYVPKTDGSNDYCYYDNGTVLISMDEGDSFVWDTSILTATKNGQTLPYTVTVDGADYTHKSITFTDTQECTVVYTYTDPYNYALSGTEVVSSGKTYEKTVQISVTAVPPAAKDAVFTFYGYNAISKTAASTYSDTTTVTANSKTYIMPATADANVKTTTIGGATINCPVVYVDFKDNASDFNWLYPVFLGVQIQDFADGGAGDGYVVVDPRSATKPENLTIVTTDSGWSVGSGQSGSEGTLSSGTYKGLYGWTGGALGSDKSESTLIAQFSYKDNKGSVYYYCIAFYRAAHTCPSCVTGDTLITLADGSQVRVDSLTGSEQLLVWNLETGMLDSAPIMFVDSEAEAEQNIIHLYFSDGTDVKVIYEHGFWDYDLNRYVYLDKDAAAYIGHSFAKQNGDTLDKVQLTNVVLEHAVTTAWSPVTAGHLCYFVNGMLSMPGGVGGLFNIFDVDAETMTYDWAAMARDMETYGLFTYEELNGIQPLPEAMFEAAGGAYLKVSVGKGNLTMEELVAMIRRYAKYF